MKEEKTESRIVSCNHIQTQDWFSWINKMPPLPNSFYVVGEVLVSNPGIDAILLPKEPQGVNPDILLLELFLHQKSGIWPRVLTWKPIRYEKNGNLHYTDVEIYCGDSIIKNISVKIAQ